MLRLPHGLEAEPLVVRRLTLRGTEAHGRIAILPGALEERFEQFLAGPLAPPARDDGDRQLGGLLVDDVDAARAQPCGLRLEVRNVDVRDGAVRFRLALCEADVHLTVPDVRPPFREVDGDLLETERLAVEPPPLVEVADVVPDGRYPGH